MTDHLPIRIGVTQRVDDHPERNERRDALDQAWIDLLQDWGYHPVIIPNRFRDVDALLEGLDGVLLTGGNDLAHLEGAIDTAPERDELERRLIDACAEQDIPLLGVCRGFQMLCDHHGSTLRRLDNHPPQQWHGLKAAGTRMPVTDRDEVNTFHSYGLLPEDLGPELEPAALATDGTVEAVVHRTLRQWGILWHPERDPFDVRDRAIADGLWRPEA